MSVIKIRSQQNLTPADPKTKMSDLDDGTVFRFHEGLLIKLGAGNKDGITVHTTNAVTLVLVPMGGIYHRYPTGVTFTMSQSTLIPARDIVSAAYLDVEYRA